MSSKNNDNNDNKNSNQKHVIVKEIYSLSYYKLNSN